MKSERRHELEQNELADWLAHKIEAIKPYQNAILGGLLLLVMVFLAYGIYARNTQATESAGWNSFYGALAQNRLSPADFDLVAKQHSGTSAADWATVIAADLYFGNGCDVLFTDKATARVDLTEAQQRYEKVLDTSKASMLRERATYGLARALESQGVDLKDAIRRYEEVEAKWPNGAYAQTATRRAEDLTRKSTKWMYDQFAKYEPAAEFEGEPGIPGSRLNFDSPNLVPDDPGFGDSPFESMRDKGDSGPSTPPLGNLSEPAVPGPAEPETTNGTTPTPESSDGNTSEPAASDSTVVETQPDDAATTEPEPTEPEPMADETAEPSAAEPEGATATEETTGQEG